MSDWYARRLQQIQQGQGHQPGTLQPQPQPQQPQALLPGQLPAHLAPYAAQPMPAPQTPQAYAGAQPGQVPQAFYSYNASTGAQMEDDGHVAQLYNSAAQTGGSKQVKENSSTCPNCGGRMFARNLTENGMPMRIEAAPQCTDCNYPVVQAGSTGGQLSNAKGAGAARPARQLSEGPRPLDPGHRVSVLDGSAMVTYEPQPGGR